MQDLVRHFFDKNTNIQRDYWKIRQVSKTKLNKAPPDLYIQGKWRDNFYTKVFVLCKTFNGQSLESMIKDIANNEFYTPDNS